MLSVQNDQRSLSTYYAIFPAMLTAWNSSTSTPAYSWKEQAWNESAQGYQDPNPMGRSGSAAYEINDLVVDVSKNPLVWMRFRSAASGDEIYEFDGTGMALAATSPAQPGTLDVQEVNASGTTVVDVPRTSTLQFDDSTGLTVSSPSANTARVKATLLDAKQLNPAADYPSTKVLEFDAATGLSLAMDGANTVKVSGTLLDVQQTSSSGGVVVDCPQTRTLEFDTPSGFVVSQAAVNKALVKLNTPFQQPSGTGQPYISTAPVQMQQPFEICGYQFWCCQVIALSSSSYPNFVLPAAATVYPTTLTAAATISGIAPIAFPAGGAAGGPQIIAITNTSAYKLTLTNEDAGSTAANRFRLPPAYGSSVALGQNDSAILWYDSCQDLRWKVLSCTVIPSTVGISGTYTLVESVTWSSGSCTLTVTTQNFTFTNGLLTAVA